MSRGATELTPDGEATLAEKCTGEANAAPNAGDTTKTPQFAIAEPVADEVEPSLSVTFTVTV